MIYLIANSRSIRLDTKNINKDDIIIHFNSCKFFPRLKNIKCKHFIYLNDNEGNWWGEKIFSKIHGKIDKVFVNKSMEKQFLCKYPSLSYKLHCLEKTMKDYPEGKLASAGFVMLNYCLKNLEDNPVKLVGFTFRGWDGHDWKYERSFSEPYILESQTLFFNIFKFIFTIS